MQGQLLGKRYRIREMIGEGGMAFVYVAIDEKLGRRVAVKVLHPQLAQNPDIRERFQMEARAISAIEHPNIIKIYDFSGAASDTLWIVTEILNGANLAEFQKRYPAGCLHPIVAAIMVREITKALHKAHSSGIIHRDVKPENIMVLDEGRIKLMDFGIAKDVSRRDITMTGTFMGSPSYMSPEQIRGKDIDHRSDIYSLGVLFYETVTGTLPYVGSTIPEVINKIMIGKFAPPMQIAPGLPAQLNDMILRTMESEPDERYSKVKYLGDEIDEFLGENGFAESHIELERYFTSRKKFEARLDELGFERRIRAYRPTSRRVPSIATQTTKEGERHGRRHEVPLPRAERAEPVAAASSQTRHTVHLPVAHPAPRPRARQSAGHPAPRPVARRTNPPQPPRINVSAPMSQSPRAIAERRVIQRRPVAVANRNTRRANQGTRRQIPKIARQASEQTVGLRLNLLPPIWFNRALGFSLILVILVVAVWGFVSLERRMQEVRPRVERVAPPPAPPPPPRLVRPERPTPVQKPTERSEMPVAKPALEAEPVVKPVKSEKVEKPVVKNERPAEKVEKPGVKPRRIEKVPTPRKTAVAAQAPAVTRAPLQPLPSVAATPEPRSNLRKDARPEAVAKPTVVPAPPSAAPTEAATEPETPPAKKDRARINFTVQPAAEIFIDGRNLGTTNDSGFERNGLKIPAGKHKVELKRKGFETISESITVKDGEDQSLTYSLQPASRSVSFTVKTQSFPTKFYIESSLEGVPVREFTLTKATTVIPLKAGTYNIKAQFGNQVIQRSVTIDPQQGLTFNADFR